MQPFRQSSLPSPRRSSLPAIASMVLVLTGALAATGCLDVRTQDKLFSGEAAAGAACGDAASGATCESESPGESASGKHGQGDLSGSSDAGTGKTSSPDGGDTPLCGAANRPCCAGDACQAGNECKAGVCHPKPLVACTADSACTSGHCECADAACSRRLCSQVACPCGFTRQGTTCEGPLDDGKRDPDGCDANRVCYQGTCRDVTYVGGIVSGDAIWEPAGRLFWLTSPVQVQKSLTVRPGVLVEGAGNGLQLYGDLLSAVGTADAPVRFRNVGIGPAGTGFTAPRHIRLIHTHLFGGSAYGGASHGALTLQDSLLEGGARVSIWYPSGDCTLERNRFYDAGGVSVGTDGLVVVRIRNNLFVRQSAPVENWASYDSSRTEVRYNSFLSTDREALRLPSGYSTAAMDGVENYWSTTEAQAIDRRIFDQKDDLGCASVIAYQPVLTQPHADTPKP